MDAQLYFKDPRFIRAMLKVLRYAQTKGNASPLKACALTMEEGMKLAGDYWPAVIEACEFYGAGLKECKQSLNFGASQFIFPIVAVCKEQLRTLRLSRRSVRLQIFFGWGNFIIAAVALALSAWAFARTF